MNKKLKLIFQVIIFIAIIIILSILYNNIIGKKQDIKNEEENKVSILKISSDNFEQEVINSEKTVLVDFYATWCAPCRMMSSILESIAEENSNIKVVKVDIDENQNLAIQYNVMSIPTMIVFKNGEPAKTFVGVTAKEDIVENL